MNIQKISTQLIKPAQYNPRVDLKPEDAAYQKLKRSLNEFGYVEPLVWNQQTGNLVGGHQRFKVLMEQGLETVDVSVVELSPEKEKALNIALNKIEGDWDEQKLAELLDELTKVPDFDVTSSGFDQTEVNSLFDEHLSLDLDLPTQDEPDTNAIAITQPGDLIQLGSHRLLCADSTSIDSLKTLLGDQKIKLLYTDVPYNCNYDASRRPSQTAGDTKWKAIQNDALDQNEYENWLKTFFEVIKPFLSAGAPAYIWNGHRQFGPMHSILTGLDFHVSNVITWVKPCVAPGYADYQMQSEFCLYVWLKDNGSHRWFGPTNETNVWEFGRDGATELIHPTQKPISLAQRAFKNSSQQGDLIVDCFAGSGSSLIAAQTLKRVCYAMEIEPTYCDSIVRRYIRTFGPDSVLPDLFQKYNA